MTRRGRRPRFELDHGRVVIAAITSCTNTSNPSVMIGAGLLARNAVERGLSRKPWVKTSLAPGSTVVTDYLERAGLDEYLDELQFNLVGYGCTTCIGNSGPLAEEISAAVTEKDLVVCAVLSGNRNFEGRINQDVKANYLASPAAGRRLRARRPHGHRPDVNEPLGEDADGEPVYLRDIWPERRRRSRRSSARSVARRCSPATTPTSSPATSDWNAVEVPDGRPLHLARLDLRAPAQLLRGDARRPARGRADHRRPRAGACSATRSPPTTSRPAGAIKKDSPAGRVADRARASSRATSTPTARAAATTR